MRTPSLSASQSGALDGLRGLAALIVVASHSSLLGLHWVPGFSLAGIGKYGVYLFFVISAFLLTDQWLTTLAERRPVGPALAGYALRRVARIYPLYLAVLLLGWAIGGKGLGVPLDTPALVDHILLLQGRDIYWSIPVEFKYYAVIPLLAGLWVWGLPLAVRLAATGLLVAGVLWMYPSAQTPLNSITLGYYLPCFFAGSVSAWWWSQHRAASAEGTAPAGFRCTPQDVALLLVLVLTVPATAGLWGASPELDHLHRAFLAWGVLWSVVLLALIRGRLPAWQWLLSSALMRRCGHWSFAIYLLHMPALYVAKRLPVPGPVRAWIGLALALAVAAVVYRWLEAPAMRAGRAWSARLTRPAR